MKKIPSAVLYAVLIVLLLYGIYGAFFYFTQDSRIFPLDEIKEVSIDRSNYPYLQEFWIDDRKSGAHVPVWYLPPYPDSSQVAQDGQTDTSFAARIPAPMLIIAHGNADVIATWVDRVDPVRKAGMGVLLPEYPGYGHATGEPSQFAITRVFAAAYDSALTRGYTWSDSVVVLGHSLGGGVAAILADVRPTAGLMLVSTFSSIRDIATKEYFLPGGLVKHPFNTKKILPTYPGPILIEHGVEDKVIRFRHANRLRESAGKNTWFTSIDPGSHDMHGDDWSGFWDHVALRFLGQVAGLFDFEVPEGQPESFSAVPEERQSLQEQMESMSEDD